jgi:hypothetical protein
MKGPGPSRTGARPARNQGAAPGSASRWVEQPARCVFNIHHFAFLAPAPCLLGLQGGLLDEPVCGAPDKSLSQSQALGAAKA